MKKSKFPTVIYVVVEEAGSPNEFLSVQEHGVEDVDDSGRPIAIYKLVTEGVVHVVRSFVPNS